MAEPLVHFKCVKEVGKLRIKIVSPGYNSLANCQFPRDIRKQDATYSAPASAVTFAKGPAGKFFYRVKKGAIKILNEVEEVAFSLESIKIFESGQEECVVCMESPNEVVIVPCGHYCLCGGCGYALEGSTKKCPLCREKIVLLVTKDEL